MIGLNPWTADLVFGSASYEPDPEPQDVCCDDSVHEHGVERDLLDRIREVRRKAVGHGNPADDDEARMACEWEESR